jgi:hypothetical protein
LAKPNALALNTTPTKPNGTTSITALGVRQLSS